MKTQSSIFITKDCLVDAQMQNASNTSKPCKSVMQPQIILERHFLGISIYKSMTTNKDNLQQYKHVLSINKTIKLITKKIT